LKSKLILITVLALGGLAQAQGFVSNLSVAVHAQGVLPGSTFTKSQALLFFPPNTQSATNAVGYGGSVRYEFGGHSALELAATYYRNSQLFYNGDTTAFTRVQSNNLEFIGSYIMRLPSNDRIKPYALLGGGAIVFSPVTDAFTTSGTPQSDTKPTFAYGFGADFPVSEHIALRLQYRGLLHGEPDFKLAAEPFGTGQKIHDPEPSIQVVYHF
jgi:opacity protein-like surface antigen